MRSRDRITTSSTQAIRCVFSCDFRSAVVRSRRVDEPYAHQTNSSVTETFKLSRGAKAGEDLDSANELKNFWAGGSVVNFTLKSHFPRI